MGNGSDAVGVAALLGMRDFVVTAQTERDGKVWLAIDRWHREVLAYHQTGGASNGPTEAVNLLIEKIRRIGHGYRNFNNYRRRLLLGCGVQWTTLPTRRIRGRQPAFIA